MTSSWQDVSTTRGVNEKARDDRLLLAMNADPPSSAAQRFWPQCMNWLQHSNAGVAVTTVEWRRVWQAYQARKAALAA